MTTKRNPEEVSLNPKNHNSPIPDPSPEKNEQDNQVSSEEKQGAGDNHWAPEAIDEGTLNTETTPKEAPMPVSEERTLAMLAHLSILLNLLTGFLGGLAAIIIYFVYKDRSRLVAYHAMQSFIFQAITWLGAGLIAGILISFGTALGFLIIPLLCLIPGFLVLLLVPASLIYGVIGAVKVNNGEDFRYWQVGDWVRYILEPEPVK